MVHTFWHFCSLEKILGKCFDMLIIGHYLDIHNGFMCTRRKDFLLNEDVFKHSTLPSSHSTTHEEENWTSVLESYWCHYVCTFTFVNFWFCLCKSNCLHFLY